MTRRIVFSVLAVLALLASACSSSPASTAPPAPGTGQFTAPPPDATPATIERVVDGDTVELTDGTTVRILSVDTPETVAPNRPVECWGPEASARTAELLPAGTDVLLASDVETHDRYGRTLAYVWRASDGLFIDAELLARGDARVLIIEPNNAHAAELTALSETARSQSLGLWGACLH